jgi:uncharacterized membrane protein YfcA
MLTPLLASRFDASVAVAAVTLPHALATAVRCWRLRANIDRDVLVQFGLLSAAGQPRGPLVAFFGLLSGFFGGVAGNQGGLRAAALTAFRLTPAAFVATATATGLLVDAARTPVYLYASGSRLIPLASPIAIAAVGAFIGTVLGERMLLGLSPRHFGQIIAVSIALLGIWLLASTFSATR